MPVSPMPPMSPMSPMPPLADPEAPPPPPPPRGRERSRCRCCCCCRSPRSPGRVPVRGRYRGLLALLAAIAAAAIGAAGAAAFLGSLRGDPRQAATAAHVLLSAGSLSVPSGPDWRYEKGISGVFLSGDVRMAAGKLQVTRGGLFLLYGQFGLTCTVPPCAPGTVTLQLWRQGSPRPLLAVPLALPGGGGADPARSALAQAVGQLHPGDVLGLALAGDVAGDEWQLRQDEREENFVGLLRIAGG